MAIKLTERIWRARGESRYTDGHRDIIKVILLLCQAGAHEDLVTAIERLGHLEMDLDRWDEARGVYEEGIRICRNAGDSFGMAHKIQHLGMVHRHAGREDEAWACFQEALSLYRGRKQPPKLNYANAIMAVVQLKEELDQVDQAKELLTEARELNQAMNVQASVGDCSNRIAKLSR